MLGTLLPFEGAFYYTGAREHARERVNTWIRHQHLFNRCIAHLDRHGVRLSGDANLGDRRMDLKQDGEQNSRHQARDKVMVLARHAPSAVARRPDDVRVSPFRA